MAKLAQGTQVNGYTHTCTIAMPYVLIIERNQETNKGKRCNVYDGLSSKGWLEAPCARVNECLTIRQKVPLTALGILSRGLGVSEAARPTSSVPAIITD